MEIKAKRNRKYPPIEVGDKVRVFRQRGPLEKEWVGDFKPNVETVQKISRSLGQTFYKVSNATKEFIRSEIILIEKKNPEAPAPAPEPEREPRVSYRMQRIITRDKKRAEKAEKEKAAAEYKESLKQAKAEAKEKVKAAKEAAGKPARRKGG